MSLNYWIQDRGVSTPEGYQAWYCPLCGKGYHVMGVETAYNYIERCRDCGATVYYKHTKGLEEKAAAARARRKQILGKAKFDATPKCEDLDLINKKLDLIIELLKKG